jgi:L-2,4-diaminobutyrate decarboxylase
MISESSHYCIPRAVKIMGLGQKAIIDIPVDGNYRMRTDLLEVFYQKALDEGKRVIALTANACSTATGSYDNLQATGEFCKKHDLWFHIDGAHGGAAVISRKYEHLLKGAELADSIVIDFHKMLMTPGLNTLILFRNGQTSWSTFAQKASYLLDEGSNDDWYNYAKRTMECTKSMMGLNVYFQFLLGGRKIFEENINRLYDMGKVFASICNIKKDIELAIEPDANIVCFRYNDKGAKLNEINRKIRDQLLKDGAFYIVQTTLVDDLYLRVSIMNPLTRKEELENLLEKVVKFGSRLRD